MRSLWRALALAWLGGIASPALADEVPPPAPAFVQDEPDAPDDEMAAAAESDEPRANTRG
jgi:hypothetical protein